MDIVLEKKKIKDYIDSISDVYFLKYVSGVIHDLNKDINLDPSTEEGLRNRLELSSNQIAAGKGITLEQLRTKIASWKK
jgi:hypothetical protein